MNQLSNELKQQAISRHLCEKWTNEWADNSTQQELIDKYKNGFDFILQQKTAWPTNEYIKANFNKELLRENLIFVDEKVNMEDAPSGVYIFNGDCEGQLTFKSWGVATIYVRHTSHLHITAQDHAKVFVRVYDNAQAEGESGASATLITRKI